MAWRRHPFDSIWDEMDEMRAELDNLFRQVPAGSRFLPAGGIRDRILPAIRGEFRVDVREHDNDILVVADLPGVDKEAVSLQLQNPRALEISCERNGEKEVTSGGFSMGERMFGTMRRIVVLPSDVTDNKAKAAFRNGVLEVTLKKTGEAKRSRIAIE